MKRLAALAGSLLLALTISSCGAASGPVGTWGDGYKTDHKPYMELSLAVDQGSSDYEQAGYLTGSDGCNRLTGQWYYGAQKITFDNLSGTLMACDDVDTWMSKAAAATLDGDTLTITDASGATIGTLDRRG